LTRSDILDTRPATRIRATLAICLLHSFSYEKSTFAVELSIAWRLLTARIACAQAGTSPTPSQLAAPEESIYAMSGNLRLADRTPRLILRPMASG